MDYNEFLANKNVRTSWNGIDNVTLHDCLFDYQKAIVSWALRKGRAAIFADCGLGKTLMQLEWANQVYKNTGKKVLIVAPLAVCEQTKRESKKFHLDTDFFDIINYEKLHTINAIDYSGVVLDESSIIKSFTGKIRNQLIDLFRDTEYRLACTATPSPNDYMELGNHAEFLGVMTYVEMLAMYFVHDGGETSKWVLKYHGKQKFWEWLCSWAVFVRKPSDIGFDGDDFELPKLIQHKHCIEDYHVKSDTLIPMAVAGLSERIGLRRDTIDIRMDKVAELAKSMTGQVLIWCDLNDEADELKKRLPEAIEIRGNDKDTVKAQAILDFADGKINMLISKAAIAGYGCNFQSSHNMIFASMNDSYEDFYQCIRRQWRYGQKHEVNVHMVFTERQQTIIENLARKHKQMENMAMEMINTTNKLTRTELAGGKTDNYVIESREDKGDGFHITLGDCVAGVSGLPDNSIDFTIYSPPFASLYTYSNSPNDMGNCNTDDEFATHFAFLAKELYRVTREGRLMSFHCMNLPSSLQRDGVIGIKDFRGDLIRLFQSVGFVYHSEVVIWKDPVIAMQRTKALGLLHKQIKKDSCMSRQGIPDYLVTMRKPGINTKPNSHTNETFPVDLWQNYASPVWMDINPSDTLQFREARESDEERHICPLQLQVIERAINLWSAPDDVVLSPFMGIGSEGYVALKMGRKFKGFELKKSYYELAKRNLETARNQLSLAI